MIKSLNKYLEHLKNLDVKTKPLWGKMSPQHMVEHLILAMQMSTGKLGELKPFSPPEKLATLKRILLSSRPLPKGFVNPYIGEDLLSLKYESMGVAVKKLNDEIDDYYNFFESNTSNKTTTNVTFGDLNFAEWEVFHNKHFTHHLAQFGITVEKSV